MLSVHAQQENALFNMGHVVPVWTTFVFTAIGDEVHLCSEKDFKSVRLMAQLYFIQSALMVCRMRSQLSKGDASVSM